MSDRDVALPGARADVARIDASVHGGSRASASAGSSWTSRAGSISWLGRQRPRRLGPLRGGGRPAGPRGVVEALGRGPLNARVDRVIPRWGRRAGRSAASRSARSATAATEPPLPSGDGRREDRARRSGHEPDASVAETMPRVYRRVRRRAGRLDQLGGRREASRLRFTRSRSTARLGRQEPAALEEILARADVLSLEQERRLPLHLA